MLVVEDAHANGLGQGDGQAGLGGVVAHELVGGHDAGSRHAVQRLGRGDGMATGNGDAGLGGYIHAAAQDLAQHIESELFIGPAHQVNGGNRGATHGIDIRQRIGRGHPSPVIGVIEHGRKKVRSGDNRQTILNLDGRGVVAIVQADQHVGVGLTNEAFDGGFQLPSGNLAGAAATGRERGELNIFGHTAILLVLREPLAAY